MVKKSLFILILLVVVVSFTYAENNTVTVKASPYSWQYVTSNDGYGSKYRFAFEAGYRYNIWKVLSVGGDFKYSNYNYEELADRYHVLSLMAQAGWTQALGENWFVNADLGIGIQDRMIGSRNAWFLALGVYAGCGYAVSENVNITAGVSFEPTFQKGSNDYAVGAMLGTDIRF